SGQAGVTGETLQRTAIQAVQGQDLPALRSRVAQQIAKVAATYRKPLIDMLLQQRSDNIQAQVELYATNALDDAAKRSLQSAFAGYGREVLNQLMGVSEQASGVGGGFGLGGGAGMPPAGGAGLPPAGPMPPMPMG